MSELAYELKAKLNKVKARLKAFMASVKENVRGIRDDLKSAQGSVETELKAIPDEILSVKTSSVDQINQTMAKIASLDPTAVSGPKEQFEKLLKKVEGFQETVKGQAVQLEDDLLSVGPTLFAEIESIPPSIDSVRKAVIREIDGLLADIEAMSGVES